MHADHQVSKQACGTDKKAIADLESKVSFPVREVHMQVVVAIYASMGAQELATIPS